MLFKIEKQILKKISKNPNETSIKISTFRKYHQNDVCKAFYSLEEKGYFKTVKCDLDCSYASYIISTKGIFYREERRHMILKNIIIPIGVSIITSTLITMLELFVCSLFS